ncbi:ectonucleoside triphosphate diphosphohydrolase 6-like [Oncorhynchus keta]|uniref:ectonucleoside triphosphate diphosphohydrolase 6-like n=1 Tax=Oncorhynchus keta TaxID=8018 RepID=UPI0015FCE116|nr:ectonucleoside triphosphate diphosphohydrolase 6-like [Oncorhynchus keta]
MCKEGILELLEVAQDGIPSSVWSSTPLVVKATAGLRLLPGEKATHLDRVREVFLESPFLSRGDSVSIMDGTDEGISAWITVNFLIEDHLGLTHRLHDIISDVQQHPHTLLTQESPFESCLRKVEKLLFQKVKKAEEAKDIEFYAFSYY